MILFHDLDCGSIGDFRVLSDFYTRNIKRKNQEFSVQIRSQSRSWDVHARPLAFVEDVKFITVRGIHINKDNVDMGDKERYI